MTKAGRPKSQGTSRDTAKTLKKSALDLFARRSFHGVSIKEVGRAANVTAAMIYYHFRDKDDLLYATIDYAIEEALQLFEDMSANMDHPAAVIHEWLQMHVRLHSELGKVLKLIIDYNHSGLQSDRVDQAIKLFYGSERDLLMAALAKGEAQGLFTLNDPEALCESLSTFLDGAVMRTMIIEDFDMESAVRMAEAILWQRLEYRSEAMGRAW
ncbi:MAG: TetR/AcrR family transcriptional regulator [Mangrovicoccus sp.]|nr:TetR/AcrR family transcriptional regulator [Mangrovicoccus sp.]